LPEAVGDLRRIVAMCDDVREFARDNTWPLLGEWDDVKDATERVLRWAEASGGTAEHISGCGAFELSPRQP